MKVLCALHWLGHTEKIMLGCRWHIIRGILINTQREFLLWSRDSNHCYWGKRWTTAKLGWGLVNCLQTAQQRGTWKGADCFLESFEKQQKDKLVGVTEQQICFWLKEGFLVTETSFRMSRQVVRSPNSMQHLGMWKGSNKFIDSFPGNPEETVIELKPN